MQQFLTSGLPVWRVARFQAESNVVPSSQALCVASIGIPYRALSLCAMRLYNNHARTR